MPTPRLLRTALIVMSACVLSFSPLRAQGALSVRICLQDGDNGQPLSNATLSVRQGDGPSAEGTTSANGCEWLTIGTPVGVEEGKPNSFEVGTAYPNPASQRAHVSLVVDQAQPVSWELYDMLGRRVRGPVREVLSGGVHALEVDLADLADGRYVLHVTGAQERASQLLSKVAMAGTSVGAFVAPAPAAHSQAAALLTITAQKAGYDPLEAQREMDDGETATLTLTPSRDGDGPVPLMDMNPGETYLGFEGGLYPGGQDTPPSAHHAEAAARANAVEPLNTAGNPDANGKIVLLSIGFSNTQQEFCGQWGPPEACKPWSFVARAMDDPQVNRSQLELVNGARGGQSILEWMDPTQREYNRIEDEVLPLFNLTEAQVQVVWLKVNNQGPSISLPNQNAEAYQLMEQYGDVLRALKVRYPNLQMVLFSSRIWAGYAEGEGGHPEPYAYESGFGVKWTIEAQIDQMATGQPDNRTGNISYDSVAPWIGWGPYIWANGASPRSDGLVWLPEEYQSDDTHPNEAGETKVGGLLLDFFKTSPYTRCWFLADGGNCG